MFGIARKLRVSTLAETFVITFKICLVIVILHWIMFMLSYETFQETLQSTKKKQKALFLVQDVDTRWNLTYQLKKLKSNLWY